LLSAAHKLDDGFGLVALGLVMADKFEVHGSF
jgi:hypothetical protein